MNHILTPGGIHMVLNGKPVTVAKSDKYFDQVVEALKRKATDAEILDILEADLRRMTAAIEVAPGIEIKGGQLYYKGDVVAGVLGERMSTMLDEGFDVAPMALFLENLMLNPSRRVVEHLYAFLEHGQCPITDDGHFLVYKAVRKDFLDIHSGTFDNSVGKVVEIPRNKVDEDPDRTCSHGLHVCSFSYLPHFSHADGHVMVCKVNPRDVVAIPRDYNNTKMRVCRYEVMAEHEGYYKDQGDVLSATSVATGTSGGTFSVQVLEDDGSWNEEDSYDRLSQAAERMEDLLTDSDVKSVRIVNTATGAVVDEQDNPDYDDGSSTDDGDDTFVLVGVKHDGSEVELGDDYDSVSDAAVDALDFEGYARIEVRDAEGRVHKTIS